MRKQYDEHGDVILSQDHKDLCRLSEQLYEAVDKLFVLEDEQDFDIHPAVAIYEDACRKLKEIMK